jgi:hypothetical protein
MPIRLSIVIPLSESKSPLSVRKEGNTKQNTSCARLPPLGAPCGRKKIFALRPRAEADSRIALIFYLIARFFPFCQTFARRFFNRRAKSNFSK